MQTKEQLLNELQANSAEWLKVYNKIEELHAIIENLEKNDQQIRNELLHHSEFQKGETVKVNCQSWAKKTGKKIGQKSQIENVMNIRSCPSDELRYYYRLDSIYCKESDLESIDPLAK